MKMIRLLIFLMILLSAFAANEVAFAQDKPAQHWSYDKLERWLRAPDRTSAEINLGAKILSGKYLARDRIQEAIWTLRFAKKFKQADSLEQKLAKTLSLEKVSFIGNLEGKDESEKFKVDDFDLFGVFKTSKPYFNNEVLAYRLDRLLNLNIVPITIFRKIPKYGFGSFQYFVRNAKYHDSFDSDYDLNMREYPDSQKNLWLLDFLLNNQDRHGDNWFKRSGNITVAIDHGHAFGRGRSGFTKINMQPELFPKGEVLRRLLQLDPSDFGDLTNLNMVNLKLLFERRDQIIRLIQSTPPKPICENLLAS